MYNLSQICYNIPAFFLTVAVGKVAGRMTVLSEVGNKVNIFYKECIYNFS